MTSLMSLCCAPRYLLSTGGHDTCSSPVTPRSLLVIRMSPRSSAASRAAPGGELREDGPRAADHDHRAGGSGAAHSGRGHGLPYRAPVRGQPMISSEKKS